MAIEERIKRDIHIYLDEKTWQELQAAAKADERSVTSLVRLFVRDALEARAKYNARVRR